MAFPAGPYTNGQTWTESGVTYTYNSTIGAWMKPSTGGGMTSATGVNSITGGGTLDADRTLSLLNDEENVFYTSAYGVDNTGVRKWIPAPTMAVYTRGYLTGPFTQPAAAYYAFSMTAKGMGLTTFFGGRTYVIDVNVQSAGAAPPIVRIMNKTTTTLIAEARGPTRVVFTPTAPLTEIGFQNGAPGSVPNATGNFSVYAI